MNNPSLPQKKHNVYWESAQMVRARLRFLTLALFKKIKVS